MRTQLIQLDYSDAVLTEFFSVNLDDWSENNLFSDLEAAVVYGKQLLTAYAEQERDADLEQLVEYQVQEEEERILLTLTVSHREKIYSRYIETREIDGKLFTHEESKQELGRWSDLPVVEKFSIAFLPADQFLMQP